MKLQPELDNLDDLDESLHENYAKGENGKFQLTLVAGLVPAGNQDTYDELKGALDNERKAKAEQQRQLRELTSSVEAMGGLDALKEQMEASADAARANLEKKGEWETLREQMNTEHQVDLGKKDETIKGLRDRLDREIRGRQVAEAIAKFEGNPNLLQPILMQATKLVGDPAAGEELRVEIQEGGVVQVDGEGNQLSVMAYVERLRENDAFAGAFKGTGNTGGGGAGGEGGEGGSGGGGGGGGGIPPELANFRRSTATNRQKVDMRRWLEKQHPKDQKAQDDAYFKLPE